MKDNHKWIIKITIFSFLATAILTYLSDIILKDLNIIFGVLIILIFIAIGVIFDIIGVATATSDSKSFYSMASQRISSAKAAIKLTKISHKVSSFCNDVIGDVCNIISGAAGIALAIKLSSIINVDQTILILLISSLIAALTIGFKAMGKPYAIKNSEKITYRVAKIIGER